ncbi:hypothetical protein Pmar_PMAR013035 [Perkinsus marinus ATCC 50983]|uniref:Uncharacterized protein n=1 Tax=Perkinsus marinus (strain ATCC 50983 / TXsc) TaxID=423536 RepID=C5LHK1_PERM5|nr:hypothetical protein Pmar_PMAR013035 [Perkinsus marinus ATCC 50983]EER03792.1 hypothetical protein Pmar_PMAR013035 [Perkinsus marinus ATCC 50983]|eukprot:XP_002771976.1 hypothetical protein Pmar_PMAR013035 [Perkinsus marinus ATCC 50983]
MSPKKPCIEEKNGIGKRFKKGNPLLRELFLMHHGVSRVMVTTSTSLFDDDADAVDARIAELRQEVAKDGHDNSQPVKKVVPKRKSGGMKKFGTSKKMDKSLGKKKTVHKKGVKSKSKKKH